MVHKGQVGTTYSLVRMETKDRGTKHHRGTVEEKFTHLSLLRGTPFADGTISKEIGQDGQGEAVDKLLEGKFQWSSINKSGIEASEEMRVFLEKL